MRQYFAATGILNLSPRKHFCSCKNFCVSVKQKQKNSYRQIKQSVLYQLTSFLMGKTAFPLHLMHCDVRFSSSTDAPTKNRNHSLLSSWHSHLAYLANTPMRLRRRFRRDRRRRLRCYKKLLSLNMDIIFISLRRSIFAAFCENRTRDNKDINDFESPPSNSKSSKVYQNQSILFE